jgi:hypothetical protein
MRSWVVARRSPVGYAYGVRIGTSMAAFVVMKRSTHPEMILWGSQV